MPTGRPKQLEGPPAGRFPTLLKVVVATLVGVLVQALPASAKTFDEYRYFRALSVDLQGRPPTQIELTAFARSDIPNAWSACIRTFCAWRSAPRSTLPHQ